MKFKKIIVLPASILCMGALFSCGTSKSSIFSGLQNGFESTKFEKYLKLPSNLFKIEEGYGRYVASSAMNNSSLFARSTDVTNFEVGTSPFFTNMPIFTPGKESSYFSFNSNENKYVSAIRYTPFSQNVSKREARNITEFYGSKDSNPVIRSVERSVRTDYNSLSRATIQSAPTDNEYIIYADKTKEDKNAIYTLFRGSSDPLSDILKAPSPQQYGKKPVVPDDIVFKKVMNDEFESIEEAKAKINELATMILSSQAMNVYSTEAECAAFGNLSGEFSSFANGSSASDDTVTDTFLSNGKDTIYLHESGVSQDVELPLHDKPADDDPRVLGYSTKTLIAKVKYNNTINRWLIENMTAAFKVYAKADENLVPYKTPKCLCSEYRHVDIGYKDLGEFGEIADADLYESPNFAVNLTFKDLTSGSGGTTKEVEFNPFTDDNMTTNGGIYDHTYSARKSGLIKNDEFVFYGDVPFGGFSFDKDSPDSTHYSIVTKLVSLNDETITVEVKPNENTIYSTLKNVLKVTEDGGIEYNAEGFSPSNAGGYTLNYGSSINFYIKIKKAASGYELSEFTLTPAAEIAH